MNPHRMLWVIPLLAVTAAAAGATLHVDPKGAGDSRKHRFTTLTAAIKELKTGDTLLIANGVYRESIDLRSASLEKTSGKRRPTSIAPERGAHPVIKGSDVVTGWQRIDKNLYAKREWPHNSQQVFVNGTGLKQIGGVIFDGFPIRANHPFASLHQSQGGIWPGRTGKGADDIVADSFFYDIEKQTLYVNTAIDITRDATVEVSTRPYLIFGSDVENLHIFGLKLVHANTTAVSQSGALTLIGNRLRLEDIDIEQVDGAGLDLTGDDITVRRTSANYCGTVGLKVRGKRAQLLDNETNFNNTRGFNKWWEAGGAKFVGAGGLQDSQVAGHRAYGNKGDGIWFDWRNNNNRIHRSVSAYNAGMGIHYESSDNAMIYDNYIFGNGQRGVYLPNSSNSIVAHNLVAANGMEGIAFVDEQRAAENGKDDAIPSGNQIVANVVAWSGKAAIVLPNNERGNLSDANVFIDANSPEMSIGWPGTAQPASKGIEAWQRLSKQDQASRSNRSNIPSAIEKQLQERQLLTTRTRREWDALLPTDTARTPAINGVASEFSRPGSKPGPDAMQLRAE
jgi:parallel beta-helix repeat protein